MKEKRLMANPLSYFSEPLMIEESACQGMLAMINERAMLLNIEAKIPSKNYAGMPNGIAVISIGGPLTFKPNFFMEFLFGAASYEAIGTAFRQALADPTVSQIVFDFNSPGGEISGVVDLIDEIYTARGQKPMIAVVNEMAYSAAYGIASAVDQIYIPRSGGVGSVGVLAIHVDVSQADAKEGLVYTIIKSGERKDDLNEHAPLSPEALGRIQADIDELDALLIDTVARNRGLKVSAVRGQEAGKFRGKAAVEAGMADNVLSWNQVMNKIASKTAKGGNRMQTAIESIKAIFTGRPELVEAAVMEAMGYIPKLAEGENVMKKEEMNTLVIGAVADIKAKILALNDICLLAGLPQMLAGFIAGDVTLEAAKTAVLDEKAKGAIPPILSTVGAINVAAENPVVSDAKRRAGIHIIK